MAANAHQQPLLNDVTDVGVIKSTTDPKPKGKSFCLSAQDQSVRPWWLIPLMWPLFGFGIGFLCCLWPWVNGKDQYATFTILLGICEILTIMLAIWICGQCPFQRNAEKWLFYWIIISMEESMVYFVNESTKKRWKITGKIPFSKLRSMGVKSVIRNTCQQDAWVILTLSDGRKLIMNKMNSGAVNPTKLFVQQVEKYLCQAQQKKENEIRRNNQQFIQDLIQNAAIAAPRDEVDGSELLHAEGHDLANNNVGLQSNDVVMEEVVVENNGTSKKCANCGDMMAREHKFCDNCGAKANFDVEHTKCGECGGLISKMSKFCPNCGTKINV